ncbi:MAG: hypothetical protein JNN28_17405 [Saprospiraceae bacterium]|nr:hypothetical protein [Saprospiraceae bacterium]
MQPLDEQELIEKYLSGELPGDQTRELEARMAKDPSLRARVELERQLQAEFSDPRKLALRDMMADIVQETPSAPKSGNRWWILMILAGLLVIGAWYFWPNAETPAHSAPPVVAPPTTDTTPVQQTAPVNPEPIAKADGQKFKPNPVFETRLGNGGIRSGDGGEVNFQAPRPNAVLPMQNKSVALSFKGQVSAGDDIQGTPLSIKVYNNQPGSKAVLELKPGVTANQDKWSFSAAQSAKLEPGVYYYTLEWTETEELIYVGKFRVEEK